MTFTIRHTIVSASDMSTMHDVELFDGDGHSIIMNAVNEKHAVDLMYALKDAIQEHTVDTALFAPDYTLA